jgi:hypothetical protein
MRKRRILSLVGALALFMTVTAVPVQADPPVQVEEPIFFIFPDVENGLAVFWNITRDDFCAWEASEFTGPPPVTEPITASFHETGQGAIVTSFHASRPIELWKFDDDVPPLLGACEDTDDQTGPWATGVVSVTANDNDLEVSGTRTNSFGDRGRGTVEDGDGGRWHYSWTFRATCLVDCEVDFSLKVENTNLQKKGN